MLADAEPLLTLGHDEMVLNRWSAWELDPAAYKRLQGDLINRLKLATTAAIEGNDEGLVRQLERIPREPAAVIGRLATALADPLEALPGGALCIMGQSVHRPTPQAWLGDRRAVLAALCRYTMETQYARATGRQDLAQRLAAWVDMLARTIRPELDP